MLQQLRIMPRQMDAWCTTLAVLEHELVYFCIITSHGAACLQLTDLLAARDTTHTPYHQGPPAPAELKPPSAVQNAEAGQEDVQATLHKAQNLKHEHMEELHHQVEELKLRVQELEHERGLSQSASTQVFERSTSREDLRRVSAWVRRVQWVVGRVYCSG